jgi:hypothetical protein
LYGCDRLPGCHARIQEIIAGPARKWTQSMDSFHTYIASAPTPNRHPTAQLPGVDVVKCDPIVLGRAGPVLGRAMPCWAPNCHLNRSYPPPIAHLCLGICWAHAGGGGDALIQHLRPSAMGGPLVGEQLVGPAAYSSQQPAAPSPQPASISCDAARPAGPVRRAGRRHGGRAGGLGGQPAARVPHASRTRPARAQRPSRPPSATSWPAGGPKQRGSPDRQNRKDSLGARRAPERRKTLP